MKKKELSTQQIDYLFDFTRQKRVRYYDVQVTAFLLYLPL